MAHGYPNQRNINVHGARFVELRTVIPPAGLFPGSVGVLNPYFRPMVPHVDVLVPFNPPVLTPVGFTLDAGLLIRMDEERTQSLLKFMVNEGLVPSPEEEMKRKDAIEKLKQIVMAWIKTVAQKRRHPKNQNVNSSATILTYGSYGLGAHGSESDIDALCVGPCFATMAMGFLLAQGTNRFPRLSISPNGGVSASSSRYVDNYPRGQSIGLSGLAMPDFHLEDFFGVLLNMLQSRPEISEIHCVKDAKVPLMRFKFNGIAIDLPYAQLKVLYVPDNVDIFNPFFLRNIDETSWKSLSGVRANMLILQLVPNMEKFQSVLRCLKLWARRRGIYCNLVGFFGGIHIVVLTAYVCQRHPTASISALISIFFEIFAFWPWPTPVMLEDGLSPVNREVAEMRSFMPIQLPCSPHEFCHSNITRSTSHRIRAEFLRGHTMTRDILRPDFEWSNLFDPFPYTKKYKRFVRIFLAASNQNELGEWVGWVKSRFRSLLLKLEDVQGFCDPNPTEYVDSEVSEPNIVFFWGLQPGRNSFMDIESVEKYFMKHIYNGYKGSFGSFELSIVESSQPPKTAQFDSRMRV